MEQRAELDDILEHVREGQVREVRFALGEVVPEDGVDRPHGRDEVRMRDAHALGGAGAAARVHDAREGFCFWQALEERLGGLGLSEVDEVGYVEDLEALAGRVEALDDGWGRRAVEYYVFDGGGGWEDFQDSWEEFGVGEDADTLGFIDGVGEAGFTEGIVGSGYRGGDGGTCV